MQKIQLTEHFNLAEFTRSATAEANGIDNSLNPDNPQHRAIIENLRNLCVQVLEPQRQFVGGPVIVSSGYRCPKLNELVGGSKNSQHMTGEAVDIVPMGQSESHRSSQFRCEAIKECFLFIQNNCFFDQLILESKGYQRWIHVSCCRDRMKNRIVSRTIKIA